jgi:DNA-directed RNA polymerase subunit RPC12/RpoP
MILQKQFKCQRCKTVFIKSESDKVVKGILPECPVCGSPVVQLEKTIVVGNKPKI